MITYFTFKMNIADSDAVSFFKRIDDNFDGKVSREEIIEAFNQVGINVTSEINSIMNNLDIDMSGYLDYTELKIVLADWTKEIKKKTS